MFEVVWLYNAQVLETNGDVFFYFLNSLLNYFLFDVWQHLQMMELSKHIRELKLILYGNSGSEPVAEACAQLTQVWVKGLIRTWYAYHTIFLQNK